MTIRIIGRSIVGAFLLSASPMLAWPMPAWSAELAVVGTGDGIEVLKALSGAFNKMESAVEVMIPPSIGSGGGLAAARARTIARAGVAPAAERGAVTEARSRVWRACS